MDRPVYANVMLRDGKIIFWNTGDKEFKRVKDFHADFYYCGIKMREMVRKYSYEIKSEKMKSSGMKGYYEAREWYKQFEIHGDSLGERAY